jgi:DNA-binding beta-propeller fold protein YncE
MSKFRCTAKLTALVVLLASSHLSAYTMFVSNNGTPYKIQKWDLASNTVVDNFATGGTLNFTKDMAIGPDGSLYVANRGACNILRFNATTGEYLGVFATSPPHGLAVDAQAIEFGPDGNLYISSYGDGRIYRYSGSTGAFMSVFANSGTGAAGMQFGPDGNLYISSFYDKCVYRFDGSTGASLGKFVSSIRDPEEIRFGPDGNLYVASYYGMDGNGVYRFNGRTGAAMGRFADMTFGYGLQFAPDGDLYASKYSGLGVARYDGVTGAFKEWVATADGNYAVGGYILITPEPGTIALLLIGGALLVRRPGRGQA